MIITYLRVRQAMGEHRRYIWPKDDFEDEKSGLAHLLSFDRPGQKEIINF